MSAGRTVLTVDRPDALAEHLAASLNERQPAFLLALLCAAVVHAAIIYAISSAPPRYIGEADGNPNAISVELVDEADLRSRSTARPQAATPPAAAAQPPQPDAARPSQAAPAQRPVDPPPIEEKKPEVSAEPSPPDLTAKETAPPDAAVKPAPPDATAKPTLPDATAKPTPPDATAKPTPPDATAKPTPPDAAAKQSKTEIDLQSAFQPPTQLDLSLPSIAALPSTSGGAQGRSSSATRPPGITRSGENDRFGRDVIRALKKTMPPPQGIKGRVTVRIFLSKTGNKADVQLVTSGGNRELDQNVIFSVNQASFPFPPEGATVADRTFRVTYVYK